MAAGHDIRGRPLLSNPRKGSHMSSMVLIGLVVIGLFCAAAVLAVVVVVLGFALGWFHLGASSAGGKRQVTFTLEQNKVLDDEHTAMDRVRHLGLLEKDNTDPPVAAKKDVAAPVA